MLTPYGLECFYILVWRHIGVYLLIPSYYILSQKVWPLPPSQRDVIYEWSLTYIHKHTPSLSLSIFPLAPMFERKSDAELSVFQVAEVPTNWYEYLIPIFGSMTVAILTLNLDPLNR